MNEHETPGSDFARSARVLGMVSAVWMTTACASAAPSAGTEAPPGPGSARDPNAPASPQTPGAPPMVVFEDPARGFSLDFFIEPQRKDAPPSDGPNGRVSGYVLVAGAKERAQLLQLVDLELAPDAPPDQTECQAMLPRIFEGFTRDEASCESVEDVRLLEHDAAGVYSISATGRSCLEIPDSTTYVHTVCDGRVPGRRLFFVLLGAGNDSQDPFNRWYVCSLKLSGEVVTCPWM